MSDPIVSSNHLQDKKPLSVEFSTGNGGIVKLAGGAGEFVFAGEQLWNLKLKLPSGSDFSVSNTDATLISTIRLDNQYTLVWQHGQLEVTVAVTLNDHLSYWRIKIENHSGGILEEVDFPIIGGIGMRPRKSPEDYLVLPWQWGALIADPLNAVANDDFVPCEWTGHERKAHQLAAEYPGIHAMQFMAYGHPGYGLYFGIHDGQANYKCFGLYGEKNGSHADLMLKNYPEKMTTPGETYHLPYPAVIGLYKGDWHAAAKIYRQWAIKQEWCGLGKVNDRRDIPQWVKDTGLWYWNWTTALQKGELETILPALLDLRKTIPHPMAFHWYGWNTQPHDSDYPDYQVDAAGEARLRRAVAAYKGAGIKVFPYLNGRLWNVDMASWQRENARDYACTKAVTGAGEAKRFYVEPYMDRPFVPMCPFTRFWQDKVIANVKRTLDYGLDGAYIDQVSSSFAVRCHNAGHGHDVGGNYWYRGYRTMMERLRLELRSQYPEAAFSSESVIECFIGSFDMFLGYQSALPATVLGRTADTIPLFSTVYHDFIPLYGTGTILNQPEFFQGLARDISGGIMPSLQGYFTADIGRAEHREKLQMLAEWSNKYYAVHDLLLDAELLDQPVVSETTATRYFDAERHAPAVSASLWQVRDGRKFLLAVNPTAQNWKIFLPPAIASCSIKEILADGREIFLATREGMVMPPYSVRLWGADD